MKHIMMTALALITSLSVQAQATSPAYAPEGAVIQLRMGGGMPVPGGLMSRAITVNESGDVNVHEIFYSAEFENRNEREYALGQVTPQDMALIKQAVADLKGGAFVQPKGPECMDAPAYSYSVVKGSVLVPVYRVANCREYQLKDKRQRPSALAIKAYLDKLLALTRN